MAAIVIIVAVVVITTCVGMSRWWSTIVIVSISLFARAVCCVKLRRFCSNAWLCSLLVHILWVNHVATLIIYDNACCSWLVISVLGICGGRSWIFTVVVGPSTLDWPLNKIAIWESVQIELQPSLQGLLRKNHDFSSALPGIYPETLLEKIIHYNLLWSNRFLQGFSQKEILIATRLLDRFQWVSRNTFRNSSKNSAMSFSRDSSNDNSRDFCWKISIRISLEISRGFLQ